ncbi:hypothetical protein Y1Q_0005995 [Alligator mississippiensis]|uniref:Uncharacterized protein n=1 Tax=Alligator mississippiensis TaxID=8496 RepID=A0A151N3J9_ALLMI|nr:hypothetical protein Y1Q_0005995 [Alligator mississippiensis]
MRHSKQAAMEIPPRPLHISSRVLHSLQLHCKCTEQVLQHREAKRRCIMQFTCFKNIKGYFGRGQSSYNPMVQQCHPAGLPHLLSKR